jgi:hypothetical protein
MFEDKKEAEKVKDLIKTKRKALVGKYLNILLKEIGETIYYNSTIEVSELIFEKIQNDNHLHPNDKELIINLDPRDIQILLSFS